jgi:hypothetical protein
MRESNLLMLKDEVSPFSWTRRFRKWDRKIEEYEDKNFFQVIYLILWNNNLGKASQAAVFSSFQVKHTHLLN